MTTSSRFPRIWARCHRSETTCAAGGFSPNLAALHSPAQKIAQIRGGIDEVLISLGVRAVRNRQRLAMSLGLERPRAHVRNPDLNGPQALLAQPLAVRPKLFAR